MHAKCILHTCLVTLESKEKRERYIYMRKREERGYVNLPLIKLYLNSQIRNSIFPIVCIKSKRMYLSAV